MSPGTDRARGLAQTLLNVPYGEGDGEKLDVYIPKGSPLGTALTRTVMLSFEDPNSYSLHKNEVPSLSDVDLVIYIHGGYWQFLRYTTVFSLHLEFKFLNILCHPGSLCVS